MEPLNDRELDEILAGWRAPDAPASLAAKVLPKRESSWTRAWSRALHGSIRIPVPVALVLLVTVLGIWFYESSRPQTHQVQQPASNSVSLADFQPVKQLEPRIARRPYEGN